MIGRSLVETVVRAVTDGWDMEGVAVAQWIDERMKRGGGGRGIEEAKRTRNNRLVKRRHVLVDLRRATPGRDETKKEPSPIKTQSILQKVTEETKIPLIV